MLTAAVCTALTGAGLALSLLTAWRRRFLPATRLAAWSLLPVGLWLTGLLPLAQKIGRAAARWGADLVFKPSVWTGIGVLALSALLFVIARLAGRRTPRGRGRVTGRDGGVPAVAPTASTGALDAPRAQRQPAKKNAAADDGLSDFQEIEEILRRRGI
jgi:hypothetical protein